MTKVHAIILAIGLALPVLVFVLLVVVARVSTSEVLTARLRRFSQSRWRPVLVGIIVLAFMGTITYAVSSGSFLRALIGAVPVASMLVGFSVFSQTLQRRGTTLRCAACEYDLTGAEPGKPLEKGAHDAKCPECGASWGLARGTVVGERMRSKRSIALAILLMLPMLSSFIIPLVAGYSAIDKAIARVMPTGSLINQVAYVSGFRMVEWAELRTRTLTPHQRETLAQGLLTRDALQLHAWGDEAKWLVAEFAAGRLSPEIQRKVLRRYVDIGLFPIDPVGTMSIRPTEEQAWGMQGCFVGWTIFAVRGPVLDASNREIAAVLPVEIEIGQAELGTPAPAISGVSSLRTTLDTVFGTSPPEGHLNVWIIAEPRVRTPQPVVWKDGVPVAAPDAIVVQFDLKPPTK